MDEGASLLDNVHAEFKDGKTPASLVLDKLFFGLRKLRNNMTHEVWDHFSRYTVPRHPLIEIIHQDPFTRRSFEKPRGYDGDARLLDFIYGYYDFKNMDITDTGKEIFTYTTNSPASKAVRARKEIIIELINKTAINVKCPRIFSLACGHLREAHSCAAIQERQIKEFIAMDYDTKTLDIVKNNFQDYNVKGYHGSVKDIIVSNKYKELGLFDVVYASGLYDYLSQRIAVRLTQRLFELLNPGGKLLFANFIPDIMDIGYMETFMDWRLIYRDSSQLNDVLSGIAQQEYCDKKFFTEDNENIAFIEITKR
ncbi:MAG: class I SAM-dependent methyltransferase [Candidatus Magnetobacterium sp. LHC-1]|uniref:Class I SAM-dependent methyltransferase n=1 Tax=Candidatus Magnetobacterium casense TaxID=1455061 RepID=A0ABS6RWZ3_9BACT|nr:class I SAM-dependent methyltransferase [Candidatus Magnetobacterium casensis]MBF0609378.1 class I SAM-dependent methyltransferase [Nitrospirota bacterium]MBV6340870.1 class I SAM-dependent methyltransferase [Candidatus Magnetobacterium casensis]